MKQKHYSINELDENKVLTDYFPKKCCSTFISYVHLAGLMSRERNMPSKRRQLSTDKSRRIGLRSLHLFVRFSTLCEKIAVLRTVHVWNLAILRSVHYQYSHFPRLSSFTTEQTTLTGLNYISRKPLEARNKIFFSFLILRSLQIWWRSTEEVYRFTQHMTIQIQRPGPRHALNEECNILADGYGEYSVEPSGCTE